MEQPPKDEGLSPEEAHDEANMIQAMARRIEAGRESVTKEDYDQAEAALADVRGSLES